MMERDQLEQEKISDRITLNVSGAVFEVRVSILQRFPQTLLGCRYKRVQYYDSARNQYFFDRHRQAFEAILFFYQSGGRLMCPDNVPDTVFADEILFFQLPTMDDRFSSKTKKFEKFMMSNQTPSRFNFQWQRRLWEFLEIPESTKMAQGLALFSQFMVYLSVTATCLETVKSLRYYDFSPQNDETGGMSFLKSNPLVQNSWFLFDIGCFGWFTFECAVRFLSFPSKAEYFANLANCVDFLTVVVFYVFLIVKITVPTAVWCLRFLRFLTTIRIFKLIRYSNKMKIFLLTLASGVRELGMLMMFSCIMLLLSSTAVFYAEAELKNTQFSSIPDAFWWAIITITTIGYGDKVPISAAGKFIGCLCAVLGALVIALPLFRFAAHFRTKLERLSDNSNLGFTSSKTKNSLMRGF
ncbi:potassium voltage-gated channel subfamily A member 10 [Nematostella vectensis]